MPRAKSIESFSVPKKGASERVTVRFIPRPAQGTIDVIEIDPPGGSVILKEPIEIELDADMVEPE